jgi:hypothetical protein
MDVSDDGERRRDPAVRNDRLSPHQRVLGDPARLGEANAGHARLDDVDVTAVHHLEELVPRDEKLPDRYRNRRPVGHLAVAVDVVEPERRLDHPDVVLLQLVQHAESLLRRLPAVADVDEQLDAVAGRLPGRLRELHDVPVRRSAVVERLDLDGAKTEPACLLDHLRRAPLRVVPVEGPGIDGAVRGYRPAARAAEQLVDRLPLRLPLDVPQRDVDRCEHSDEQAAPPRHRGRSVREIPQPLRLQRIPTDQDVLDPLAPAVRPGRVDERLHRARRVVALAVADDSLVGVDANDERILHRVGRRHVDRRFLDDHRLDVRDLHARTTLLSAAVCPHKRTRSSRCVYD